MILVYLDGKLLTPGSSRHYTLGSDGIPRLTQEVRKRVESDSVIQVITISGDFEGRRLYQVGLVCGEVTLKGIPVD